MKRREFLKTSVALAAATDLAASKAMGYVPAHNWDKYDFGLGPSVTDRLNQGPFPQYAPEALQKLGHAAVTLAEAEGLYGHAAAIRSRLDTFRDNLSGATVLQSPRPTGRRRPGTRQDKATSSLKMPLEATRA